MARRNWPIPSSCGSTPLMSKAALEPMPMTPISTSSWTARLSSPPAMKMRAMPVHLKKMRRSMTRAPR